MTDFPSASAVEYQDGRLFLFGDDATHLLILDTNYRSIDKIHYLPDSSFRMRKNEKADIESAALISTDNGSELMALGSFSSKNRMSLFQFSLASNSVSVVDLSFISEKLKAIPELNIEGLAIVGGNIVLANRANKKHPVNKLVIGNNDLRTFSPSSIIAMHFRGKNVVGVSGLYYVKERDLLLFTASEENTYSATEDGAISDSYLGWIHNFSKKLTDRSIQPSELISLSSVDKTFTKQKIESVCVQGINGDEMLIHLVSDNDDGRSGLFKMRLRF